LVGDQPGVKELPSNAVDAACNMPAGDGYTTFLNGKNLLGGAQDIDALVAYLGQFKVPNPAYAPSTHPDDLGAPRINRIGGSTCPTGANVNP
jgi:5'-nucleotidase